MTQDTCRVPGCDRLLVHRVGGWCLMHYKRWRRRGTVHDITPEERFFACVAEVGDCWVWCGTTLPAGYGVFGVGKRQVLAHRWSYEYMRAEIPDGLHIDHLCSNPPCVNPWHLEPVTPRVNVLRSRGLTAINARKTHCINGHPFNEDNTYIKPSNGTRGCRICRAAADRRFASKKK